MEGKCTKQTEQDIVQETENPAVLPECKIVLVGCERSGKSALMDRLARGQFNNSYNPTIGARFSACNILSTKRKQTKLNIWDLSGSKRYHALMPMYWRGAAVLVITFDTCSADSLSSADDMLLLVKEARIEGLLGKVLVGCKCDLEQDRKVSFEEGAMKAQEHGVAYIETTAKDGVNVEELFRFAVDICEGES